MDFPGSANGKEPVCQCRRCKRYGFHPWVGEGHGNPLQYSYLENPMDRGARQATVHRVAKSWTWLSTQRETFLVHRNSQLTGVGHWHLVIVGRGFLGGSASKDSTCNAWDFSLIPGLGWSPGEEKGYPIQYSGLENYMDYIYSPWGRKESDTTEQLPLYFTL